METISKTPESVNLKKFIKELRKLTGVSREYAIASWYSLNECDRTKPVLAAVEVTRRYSLQLDSPEHVKREKFTYKDFITSKLKWTRGKFGGWTNPTGLINGKYAIFHRPSTDLFVPVYLLTPETERRLVKLEKSRLDPLVTSDKVMDGVLANMNK